MDSERINCIQPWYREETVMLSPQSIVIARKAVGRIAVRTPLVPAASLSTPNRAVRLKLEMD